VYGLSFGIEWRAEEAIKLRKTQLAVVLLVPPFPIRCTNSLEDFALAVVGRVTLCEMKMQASPERHDLIRADLFAVVTINNSKQLLVARALMRVPVLARDVLAPSKAVRNPRFDRESVLLVVLSFYGMLLLARFEDCIILIDGAVLSEADIIVIGMHVRRCDSDESEEKCHHSPLASSHRSWQAMNPLESRLHTAEPALYPLSFSAKGARWVSEGRQSWRQDRSNAVQQTCPLLVSVFGCDADKDSDELLKAIAYDNDPILASASLRTLATTCRRINVAVSSSPYIPALRQGLELYPHQVGPLSYR